MILHYLVLESNKVPVLGSWALLSRMEQHREAAGGRALRILKSREGFSVCE